MRTPRRSTVALLAAGLCASGLTAASAQGARAATAAPGTTAATSTATTTTTSTSLTSTDETARDSGITRDPQAADLQRSAKLRRAVSADGVMTHLRAFQRIADANDGNRASGTSGYEASAAYLEKTLKPYGYKITRQPFEFRYEQITKTSLDQTAPQRRAVEHNPMSYSPAAPGAGVTAELVAPAEVNGCDAAAWQGVDATGKIALVSRGTCSFGQKSKAAHAAGAAAAIIYNNADGPLNGTLGEVADDYVPTTGVTQADGQALRTAMQSGPVSMTFVLEKIMEQRKTFNVIAESAGGNADNVVMAGAHLDSVAEGAGTNDNGSGSAAILEVAKQIGQQRNVPGKLPNKMRFAWWGAEEVGLLGSTHYVENLTANDPAALKKIATYLNFDMVGSPNYMIGVYDADESTHKAPVPVPPGSVETEKLFTSYFDATKQPWVDTEFSGRSDYQAFIENGVPASGLFTGAEGKKTAAEQAKFGGTAGLAYDPNYHQPKDDLSNVSTKALEINSDAIAHAMLTLATSTEAVNGKK